MWEFYVGVLMTCRPQTLAVYREQKRYMRTDTHILIYIHVCVYIGRDVICIDPNYILF